MSSPVEHSIYIPEFTTEQVFGAGTQRKSLVTENGLTIDTEDEQFKLGTPFDVGVKVAKHDFLIPSFITVFEPAKQVTIFGESDIGEVTVGLALSSYEDGEYEDQKGPGAQVDYSILINHKGFIRKLAEPVVKKHLEHTLPRLAEKHKKKVIKLIKATNALAALVEA